MTHTSLDPYIVKTAVEGNMEKREEIPVADRIKQGHVLTTTCDFKWGGAKKPIAPITVKKNCLDLYQAQKYPLIVFH